MYLLLDGGKGQLNIAVEVIRRLGIEGRFALAAIAKKDERKGETNDKIYRPRRANPVNFGKDEALLLFLQRIRDEAHRFAIRYHRQRRRKAATESILDDIPGIGPRRRRILLRTYGTIERIRAAPPDQLKALPGMDSRAVKNLIARLHPPKR